VDGAAPVVCAAPVVWPVAPTVGPEPASRFADVPVVLHGPACAAPALETIAANVARISILFAIMLLSSVLSSGSVAMLQGTGRDNRTEDFRFLAGCEMARAITGPCTENAAGVPARDCSFPMIPGRYAGGFKPGDASQSLR
jgi:hypothetical protein